MFKNIEKKIKVLNNNFYAELFICFIIFISWFIFNRLMPIMGDDEYYQYIVGISDKIRVSNLSDLFLSQYNHYLIWGGRTVAHTLDQFFLMYDKLYFDIANSFVFVCSIYTIYSFRRNKKRNVLLLLFIFLSYWFFGADLLRPFLNQTSSFNYSWMILLSLLFIKLYYSIYDTIDTKNKKIFVCILFFVYSLIAGWGHEVISPVVIIALIIYFIYKYQNRIKILNIEIFGFIGYFIGTSFLMFSPGNFVRAKAITGIGIFSNTLLFKYIVALFRNGYFVIYYAMPVLIAMGVVLIISHFKIKSDSLIYDKEIKKTWFYLFVLMFSVFFFFFMLGYANACVVVPLTVMLIIIVRYFDYVDFDKYFTPISFVILMLTLLFIVQAIATIYYLISRGGYIEHHYNLVG